MEVLVRREAYRQVSEGDLSNKDDRRWRRMDMIDDLLPLETKKELKRLNRLLSDRQGELTATMVSKIKR